MTEPGFSTPQSYPQQAPVYPQQQGYPQPAPVYPPQAQGYPQGYAQQGYPQQGGQPQGYANYPTANSNVSVNVNVSVNMDASADPIPAAQDDGMDFSDKSIRRGFIRKVYTILALQLALTSAIIGLFYIPEFRAWNEENPGLLIASGVMTIVLVIALACTPNLRRRAPANIIVLLVFTACEGLLLGSCCAVYSTDAVVKAAVMTVVIFVGLTLFAFQTKIDFTMLAGIMFTILWGLMLFGFMCLIFQNEALYNFYAALAAMVFGVYIVIDTQLLMGGKHKLSISPEEYIFAALNLYLDIINLFLLLLRLFGDN